jgi:predicted RNA-binding Zn ribbon-like protein
VSTALDLLNTRRRIDGRTEDRLADPATGAAWLAAHGYEGLPKSAALLALTQARDAITCAAGSQADLAPLNAILEKGRILLQARVDGAHEEVEVADPAWRPAFDAARDAVDLVAGASGRLRPCNHHDCVLWFLDATRSGTRRWCSMASCGNRAKAARHRARQRR